ALERGGAGGHRLGRERIGLNGSRGEDRVRGNRALERERVCVVGVPEGEQLGDWAVRQGSELGIDELLVGPAGAPYGLCRVVDEDVERALLSNRVGERDDLGGVAEIDADDAEATDPFAGI